MRKSDKPTVVVVDDDHMMREHLKLILVSEDYPVIGEATDGERAIALCQHLHPELVLLDINMPKMDGLQALESIHKACPSTKVVMVSAEATMDKVKEAIGKGASGFVVKPYDAACVLERIASCFKGRG